MDRQIFANIASTPCTVAPDRSEPRRIDAHAGRLLLLNLRAVDRRLEPERPRHPNALFLFKIGSTLTTASGSSVSVINGGVGGTVKAKKGGITFTKPWSSAP